MPRTQGDMAPSHRMGRDGEKAAHKPTAAMAKLTRECVDWFSRLYAQPLVMQWGEGRAGSRIALVGKAPSERDILAGTMRQGRGGKAIDALLAQVGLHPGDVYQTLAVKQRAVKADGTARQPTREEIALWTPWLERELLLVKPRLIVAMGNTALRALGERDAPPMSEARGRPFAHPRLMVPVFPIRHPASLAGNPEEQAAMAADVAALAATIKDLEGQ